MFEADWRSRMALLARYALAGGLTSLVYILVYNGLVEILGMVRFFASNMAYGCALLFQWFAHGLFTFGHRSVPKGVFGRYITVVGFGFLMAAAISQANTKLYTLEDWIVSLIVMVLVATSNFIGFTFWVYRDAPQASEPLP